MVIFLLFYSKLLVHLDAAVDQMPSALERAVASKAYMARLVEVQHMRGATGGSTFKGLLISEEPKKEPEDKKEKGIVFCFCHPWFICWFRLCCVYA